MAESTLPEPTQQYLDSLYANVSGYIPYEPSDKPEYVRDTIYPTYGELSSESIQNLLNFIKLTEDDHFIDLGSGIGKLSLYIFCQTKVQSVTGIEAIDTRHSKALKAAKKLTEQYPHLLTKQRKLDFFCDNITQFSFDQATVVYACSTSFGDDLLEIIGQKISEAPKIRTVASLTPIPSLKAFNLAEKLNVKCSWDKEVCYLYQK